MHTVRDNEEQVRKHKGGENTLKPNSPGVWGCLHTVAQVKILTHISAKDWKSGSGLKCLDLRVSIFMHSEIFTHML